MLLADVKQIIGARVLCGEDDLDREAGGVCACDLMSDVLACPRPGGILLTGLVNPHVVRTADMTDMHCIVFVRGKMPGEDILRLAADRGIPVMSTEDQMYTACGKLYAMGLDRGGDR